MSLFYFLLVYFVLIFSVGGRDNKIYGGKEAKDGEYPYAVSLTVIREKTSMVLAGGFLVSLDKVITAAHFFHPGFEMEAAFMVGGTTRKTDKSGGYQERKFKSYKIHEKFEDRSSQNLPNKNDIASIEPESPFQLSETLKLGKVHSKDVFDKSWDELVKADTLCYTLGWGKTSDTQLHSETLKVIETKPMDEKKCSKNTDLVTFGMICSLNVHRGDSPCGGDSGAPYICNGFIYAVYDAGPSSCQSPEKPNLFLSLAPYIDYFKIPTSSAFLPSPLLTLLFFNKIIGCF